MNWFLDTNTCIYALKGSYPAIQAHLFRHVPERIKIPAIVAGELLLGAEKSRQGERVRLAVEQFLAPFEIVPFDRGAAEHYARIRGHLERIGKPIGPNDLLIAATALAAEGTLVTHNTREFSRVPGLALCDWTR